MKYKIYIIQDKIKKVIKNNKKKIKPLNFYLKYFYT